MSYFLVGPRFESPVVRKVMVMGSNPTLHTLQLNQDHMLYLTTSQSIRGSTSFPAWHF